MRLRWILSLFFCCILLSCSEASQPQLAEITHIGPDFVEPGDVLRVTGRGFVEGPATVTLNGALGPLGPGAPKQSHIVLKGNATSENCVEVPITSRLMKSIAQEPSCFLGGVEVSFPVAVEGAVRIFALQHHVSVEFRPGGVGVAVQARRERQASRFLSDLGLKVLDTREVDGVVVSEVREGSPADAAGVSFGDRLLAVDGVAVAGTADLAALSSKRKHHFEVISRDGVLREADVSALSGRVVDQDELAAILLTSVALGFFIALVAPRRRQWDLLHLGVSDPFARALGFGIVSLILLLVPAANFLLESSFIITIVLLGLNALSLVTIYVFAETDKRSLLTSLFCLLPIPAFIAVSGYLSSAVGLNDIVLSQKSTSYGVHAVAGPFPLLVAVSSLILLWPEQPAGFKQNKIVTIATWVAAASGAAVLVSCLLGGWLIPFFPVSPSGLLFAFGCLVFLVKSWFVILIARWLATFHIMDRRAKRRTRRPWFSTVILSTSTIAAIGCTLFAIPRSFEAAGQVLALAMLITLLTAVIVMGTRSILFGPSLPKNSRYTGFGTPPVPAK